ncbi:putative regulatory protein, FmdB family [Nostocoides australiense Ben110]|uniref:Putative regulatory protein, FmdB family n=1 Tax=Nostocoides australiense Ben110 TaxID=1193182 RepID=W6JUH9_9MICO|nr:putative regulatory protein, FmdB family [Tetrasphaera australiensis Ben110]
MPPGPRRVRRLVFRRTSLPTYAYACADCGHAFDIVQSFSDDSLTVCPECEGRLRKQFNAVGVVFKGSGFYRTDSRSSSTSSVPSSGGSSSGSSSSSSSGGSSGSGDSSSSSSASSSSTSSTPAKSTSAVSTGS